MEEKACKSGEEIKRTFPSLVTRGETERKRPRTHCSGERGHQVKKKNLGRKGNVTERGEIIPSERQARTGMYRGKSSHEPVRGPWWVNRGGKSGEAGGEKERCPFRQRGKEPSRIRLLRFTWRDIERDETWKYLLERTSVRPQ